MMNKILDTNHRIFMSLVGPSGCGKTRLVFELLTKNIFYPSFGKIFYFYEHDQPLFREYDFLTNIEYINGVNFDMIRALPNDGTKYLLIFDDSCDEICRSKDFQTIATAGRHRGLNVLYLKHNLFHKSPLGRDIELQLTHIVIFKNPRDIHQIKILGRQLGLGNELDVWYKTATQKPYGYILIDLCPKTNDSLRYSSDLDPTIFYLPKHKARTTVLNDAHTLRVYSQENNVSTKAHAVNSSEESW